jgi:hypothetical protein
MANFKPDVSFFRKIVIGAHGTQATCEDLAKYGHEMVELERGSTNTKLWKDVKRKRVRIPDLICKNCGQRVESRTKTKPELSMSHSDSDQERSWDYGMLENDWIAFPISVATISTTWSKGLFRNKAAYWHERDWSQWNVEGKINYFTVNSLRRVAPDVTRRKGVTEGSELTLTWNAKFATCSGKVESIVNEVIKLHADSGRVRSLKISPNLNTFVKAGDEVIKNQILCAGPAPINTEALRCPKRLSDGFIESCLASRERTVRFSGVKLSRLCHMTKHHSTIIEIANDMQEDLYVRLEAVAYLASVGKIPVDKLFEEYLQSPDPQIRLESVITIGEIRTNGAVELLGVILHDQKQEYFLRSAAAWALGNAPMVKSQEQLKKAFADVSSDIREEALDALVAIGESALPILLPGIEEDNEDIAVGCAEVVRQLTGDTPITLKKIAQQLQQPSPPKWLVWLAGYMNPEELKVAVGDPAVLKPEVNYALNLLWSFSRSWVARRWEFQRGIFLSNRV